MARPAQDPRSEVVTGPGVRTRTPATVVPRAHRASSPVDVPVEAEVVTPTERPVEAPVEPVIGDPRWSNDTAQVDVSALIEAPTAPPNTSRTAPAPAARVPASERTPPKVRDHPVGDSTSDRTGSTPMRLPVVVPSRRRPRVRRVTRVIRSVDTWSAFKISLLFFVLVYLSALLSGVLLWNVAYVTGTVDNIERFLESFGWETFEFNGGQIYRAAWVTGLFLVVGLTGLVVLGATTFNLITDLVGGLRVTVLEEEVVVRAPSQNGSRPRGAGNTAAGESSAG